MRLKIICRVKGMLITMLASLLLLSASMAQGAATLYTDQAAWEANVSNIEVLTTNADNILLADEVITLPGTNEYLGSLLTFQAVNTGLSRGFAVEALEPGAGFTFDDHESGVPLPKFEEALSVGDNDDFEDDDWSLSILDGASVMAFGVEIRHARFAQGESIILYANGIEIEALDLDSLPDTGNDNYFIGIISDVPFDSLVFDEDPDGDDIAVADFRFATIAPVISEISAKIDIKPEKINLKSRGNYVTAFIELPDGYSVEDINLESVAITHIDSDELNPPLYASRVYSIGDHDENLIADIKVKFSRRKLYRLLTIKDKSITISGELNNGIHFDGKDSIRVKFKNKKKYKKHLKKYRKYRRIHR